MTNKQLIYTMVILFSAIILLTVVISLEKHRVNLEQNGEHNKVVESLIWDAKKQKSVSPCE